jgi:hypothetical protein
MHEVRAFNFTYRYIDDVLSINNSRFAEYLPLIYPDDILERGNSEQSLVSFVLLLEFHPKMTNWTFNNSPSFTQLFIDTIIIL